MSLGQPGARGDTTRLSASAAGAIAPQVALSTLAKAASVATGIEDASSRVTALASIARLLHRAGECSGGASVTATALAVARNIPVSSARVGACRYRADSGRNRARRAGTGNYLGSRRSASANRRRWGLGISPWLDGEGAGGSWQYVRCVGYSRTH